MAPLLVSAMTRSANRTHRHRYSQLGAAAAALSSQGAAPWLWLSSQGIAISQPQSTAISQPQSTAISQPQSTAISQPQSPAISQPQDTSFLRTQGTAILQAQGTPGGARGACSNPGAAEVDRTPRSTQQWKLASLQGIEQRDGSLRRPPQSSHFPYSTNSSHCPHSPPQDASLAQISPPWLSSFSFTSRSVHLLSTSQRQLVSRTLSTAAAEASQRQFVSRTLSTAAAEASQRQLVSRTLSTAAAEASQEGLELTDSCVERMKQLQEEEGKAVFLRLAVEGGGCSGFQYIFTLEDAPREDDKVFRKGDAVLLVDDVTLSFVKGSKINFAEELIRSSFEVVENPNSSSSCGCGASFVAK